jgi:hypothetical protein
LKKIHEFSTKTICKKWLVILAIAVQKQKKKGLIADGFRKNTPIDRSGLARAESDQDHLVRNLEKSYHGASSI